MDAFVALFTLSAMEIVLGIDNVIFIAIIAGRLPLNQQDRARKIGLALALITRLLLLSVLFYLNTLEKTVLLNWTYLGIPESWFPELHKPDDLPGHLLSVKRLVLLLGGGFLIAKATMEIHHKLEGHEEETSAGKASSFNLILFQIALIDIVFSLDSVITAVGMASQIWVMVVAMFIATGVMVIFSGTISDFVARHPTVKILALAFLILIGVMLVAEGVGGYISKGYIYFAMAFSVVVEMINLRIRAKSEPVHLHEKKYPVRTP